MTDPLITEMVATLARVEERQEHLVERVDELHLIVVRVDSLEGTRDKQRGAAKVGVMLLAAAGSVFAALRFWD